MDVGIFLKAHTIHMFAPLRCLSQVYLTQKDALYVWEVELHLLTFYAF